MGPKLTFPDDLDDALRSLPSLIPSFAPANRFGVAHDGPGAVVAGNVTVGAKTMLGVGFIILPGITIAAEAMVGADTVVARDVPDSCLVLGNPDRIGCDGRDTRPTE